jgi:hypothetical protein
MLESNWMERSYRKKHEIVSRMIAGETILVPIRGKLADMQHIFSVNPVGSCVWDSMADNVTGAELVDSVLDRFAVERPEAEGDARLFLEQLLEADLIEVIS